MAYNRSASLCPEACGVFSSLHLLISYLFQYFQDRRCHLPDQGPGREGRMEEDNTQIDTSLLTSNISCWYLGFPQLNANSGIKPAPFPRTMCVVITVLGALWGRAQGCGYWEPKGKPHLHSW